MSKSYKLKNNNFIDSSGITHNRKKLNDVLTELIPEIIWEGKCLYSNTACQIDRTIYKKIEVYCRHGIKKGVLGSPYNNDIIVSIDCKDLESHMAGGCFSVSGSATAGLYEIVLKEGSNADLYMDWCCTYSLSSPGNFTAHLNDNEYYCYKIIGFK